MKIFILVLFVVLLPQLIWASDEMAYIPQLIKDIKDGEKALNKYSRPLYYENWGPADQKVSSSFRVHGCIVGRQMTVANRSDGNKLTYREQGPIDLRPASLEIKKKDYQKKDKSSKPEERYLLENNTNERGWTVVLDNNKLYFKSKKERDSVHGLLINHVDKCKLLDAYLQNEDLEHIKEEVCLDRGTTSERFFKKYLPFLFSDPDPQVVKSQAREFLEWFQMKDPLPAAIQETFSRQSTLSKKEAKLVEMIDQAQSTIVIHGLSRFDWNMKSYKVDIYKALLRAAKRGVEVSIYENPYWVTKYFALDQSFNLQQTLLELVDNSMDYKKIEVYLTEDQVSDNNPYFTIDSNRIFDSQGERDYVDFNLLEMRFRTGSKKFDYQSLIAAQFPIIDEEAMFD